MRFPYFGRVKKVCQTIDRLYDVEMWIMLITMWAMLILFKNHVSNFWLTIKTKAWKGKWASETHHETQAHFHKCEKMQGNESQHFQVDFHFGNCSLVVVPNFCDKSPYRKPCFNSKHWKGLQMKILKMNLHSPVGDWKLKLWIKLCFDPSFGLVINVGAQKRMKARRMCWNSHVWV